MSTLFIATWRSAVEVARGDPLQEMVVTIGAGSLQSAAITGQNKARNRVRLYADVDCFVTWNEDPTALTDGTDGRPLGRNNVEYFDIEAGHKIAVIERT